MSNPVARSWGRLGITAKLWFAFSLLFLFFAMASIAGFVGLEVVRGAETDILANMEVRHKVLEMEGQLEKARRLYRDFILHAPQIGFSQAFENYGQPALAVAARVIALSEDLKRGLATSGQAGESAKRNVDITLFAATAKRFSQTLLSENELIGQLADPDNGLETRLTAVMARLGRLLAASAACSLTLREADALEKQYRLTRQRPSMQSALNKIGALRQAVSGVPELTPEQRREAAELLDAYDALAARMLDVAVALNANANDFLLQARAVDPISEELKALTAAGVTRARGRIDWASRLAGGIILLSALLGLGCVIVVGRCLHASITSKIVELTQHAAALRAGHLDVVVQTGGHDELGILAEAINAMTRRIRDLVENLEDRVRRRTRELAAKNRELDGKNRTLEVLSLTDRLTGLCNRRKLDQALEAEWRRAERYATPFSVIMVDLDNFKAVNDTHGHEAGDAVLVRVADILTGLSRDTDIVGRWGGEEFLLICPETELSEAGVLAEKLRREIAATSFPAIDALTASFGLAQYAQDLEPGLLVSRADAALYLAKESGRNRIETGLGGTGRLDA